MGAPGLWCLLLEKSGVLAVAATGLSGVVCFQLLGVAVVCPSANYCGGVTGVSEVSVGLHTSSRSGATGHSLCVPTAGGRGE